MEEGSLRSKETVRDCAHPPRLRTAIIGIVLGFLLIAAVGRWLDGLEADDLQHLHAAWLVAQGQVPYRDYFDHHTPLYHVLFAPYASLIGRDPLVLMITFRLMAAACAIGIFFLFWRLLARLSGPFSAWLGLGLLAASRHSDLLFSLRPDYIALLLLLAAVTLVTESSERSPLRHFVAGICVGVGFGFTQKVLALAPAFVIWAAVPFLRDRENRRAQLLNLAALLIGMMLAPALLVAALAKAGALPGFLAGPIGFASHWSQPKSWLNFTQEPVLLEFPLFAFGFAWAVRSIWNWWKRADASPADTLLGLLALFGTAGLLTTPAPTQQAYMITMSLWLHASGVRFLFHLLDNNGSSRPAPAARYQTLVGAALSLLLLTSYNMLAAILASGLLYVTWVRGKAFMERRGLAAVWAFGLLAFPPAVASVATSVDRVFRNTAGAQIRAMQAIDAHIGANEAALTTWPVYTPFRPHATFHWFSDTGMYTSMPLETLRREYLTALNDPRTAVAVIDRKDWQKYLPDVLRELEARYQELNVPRGGVAKARVYIKREVNLP